MSTMGKPALNPLDLAIAKSALHRLHWILFQPLASG